MTGPHAPPPVATIGYEGRTQAEVIARLRSAGVELLVDVRAIAASRRPGFSKTLLAASLEEAGIAYLHLRDLGTPKPGREAARAGRVAEMRAIYADALQSPEAILAFERLAQAAATARTCLLCYEAHAAGCHRAVLAERLRERLGMGVEDL